MKDSQKVINEQLNQIADLNDKLQLLNQKLEYTKQTTDQNKSEQAIQISDLMQQLEKLSNSIIELKTQNKLL